MLKYVIAAVTVALAWIITLVLSLPILIAIVVSCFVLVILGLVILITILAARRGARRLEKGLSAQADAYASGVKPEDQARVQSMKTDFTRALESLKASKLGGGGSSALYALPWYMMLGPPGAGKTTAIENSGLTFPGHKKKLRGVGGTRNCEWWLSNQAVILDTAGRYSVKEDDHEEWLQFLDLLRRSRPRKPLNGIMIAVSIEELLKSEDEVIEVGVTLKERVAEVSERLKMVFPSYVVLTKCDMLPGFTDMFGGLTKPQRSQMWGYTVRPEELERSTAGEMFLERFDELQKVLERRSLHRLAAERREDSRERIFQFPEQFAALRGGLRLFMDTLYAPDAYQEAPQLRALCFTSGTQEGRPIDRIKHELARALNVEPRASGEEEVTEKKSYFLRDVFMKIVFPDASLAVKSRREVRRLSTKLLILGAVSVAAAATLAAIPLYASRKQRELVRGVRAVVENIAERPKRSGFPLAEAEELRQRLPGLCGTPGEAAAWLPKQSPLYRNACDLYAFLFRENVLNAVLSATDAQAQRLLELGKQRSGNLTGEEYGRLCSNLKLHLLLTDGAAPSEPTLEKADDPAREWLAGRLVELWPKGKPTNPLPPEGERRDEVEFYLSVLSAKGDDVPAVRLKEHREANLVNDVRRALGQNASRSLLAEIIDDTEKEYEGQDLGLDELLGGPQLHYSSPGKIRRAFTRDAWEKHVQRRILASLENCDGWVIAGNGAGSGTADPMRQIEDVKKLYFQEYVKEWKHLLTQISFRSPLTDELKEKTIDELVAGPPTPLHQLMKSVAYNAMLDITPKEPARGTGILDKLEEKGSKAAEAKLAKVGLGKEEAPPPPLKRQYAKLVKDQLYPFALFGVPSDEVGASGEGAAKTPLDTYVDELTKLRADFDAQVVQKPEEAENFAHSARNAEDRVRAMIGKRGGEWRPALEQILLPPIESLQRAGAESGDREGNLEWCNRVVAPFKALKEQFPFDPSSRSDAALDKVVDLLKPKSGVVWSFYSEALSKDIEQAGTQFRFRGEAAKHYNPQILSFLSKAQIVTSELFVGDTPRVRMQATLHLVPGVEYVRLEVGAQKVEHKGGKDLPRMIDWPGSGDSFASSIFVKGRDHDGHPQQWERSEPNGEWALFRLMGSGNITPTSNRDLTVAWPMETLGGEVLRVDFKATSDSPIMGGAGGTAEQFMQPFVALARTIPSSLRLGGGGCPSR